MNKYTKTVLTRLLKVILAIPTIILFLILFTLSIILDAVLGFWLWLILFVTSYIFQFNERIHHYFEERNIWIEILLPFTALCIKLLDITLDAFMEE